MRLNLVFITATIISSVVSGARINPRTSASIASKRFSRSAEVRDLGKKFAPKKKFARRDIPQYRCTEEDSEEIENMEENEKEEQLKPEALTKNEVDELHRFVANLKTFIHETHFEVVAFEKAFDQLKEDLADVSFLAHREKLTPDISKQLAFAKNLFGVMEEALMEYLKETESPEKPENPWAYKISELLVQAWGLLDSYGIPDTKIEGFGEKVFHVHTSVAHLRHLFEKHMVNAEQTIDMLVNSIWS